MPPNGYITFYPSKHEFHAVCTRCPGKCVVTRVNYANENQIRLPAQGRPLGLLMSFLLSCHGGEGRASHKAGWDKSFKCRCDARDVLRETPGSRPLFEQERRQRAGEGPEPEQCQ
eukprot:97536-Pyramimonas_sp.AAC.1